MILVPVLLVLTGVGFLINSPGKRFTFPIEGLVLPKGSTVVEVREMKFPPNTGKGVVVEFNSMSSHQDVFTHIDSFLVEQQFAVAPESQPFSPKDFVRMYRSTDSSISVMFAYYASDPVDSDTRSDDNWANYSLGVCETYQSFERNLPDHDE